MPTPPEKKKKPILTTGFKTKTHIIEQIITEDGTPMLLRFDKETGTIDPYMDDEFEHEGKKYSPYALDSGLVKKTPFSSNADEYGTFSELFEEVRAFISHWVQLEEFSELLATYYVLFTWVYDDFREVPYLRVLADLGSGKSRLAVSVLGSLVYKPYRTVGASSLAAGYRMLDMTHGTFVLDEADLNDSDKNSELIQILNMGYMSGLSISKCVPAARGGFDIESYDVFGPKIIAGRESMKDSALESRCLTVRLSPLTRKIPFITDDTLYDASQGLRNKLLMFRFRNSGTLFPKIDHTLEDLQIQPRTKQLLLIISSIIDTDEMRAQLHTYAQQLNDKTLDLRSDSFEADLINAIIPHMKRENLNAATSTYFIPTKNVMDTFNEEKDQYDKTRLYDLKSAGRAIKKKLNIEGDRQQKDGLQSRGIKFTWMQIANLCKSYGIPIPPVIAPEGFDPLTATQEDLDKLLPTF